jgi:cytochrome c553
MSKATTLLLALAGALTSAHAQDASKGELKAAMCIGCHGIPGYQSSFPEVHKVPMISGQNAKYIASALAAYKKGDRRHPTMRAIAGSLNDGDMADLAAYYEKSGATLIKPVADTPAAAPSAEVAALLAKGGCVACHGANYSKPIDPGYPKIAGQHADYLAAALRAYATTGNPNIGRANAVMAAQVKQFKPAELKAMANYIGSLPGEVRTVRQAPFKFN